MINKNKLWKVTQRLGYEPIEAYGEIIQEDEMGFILLTHNGDHYHINHNSDYDLELISGGEKNARR